MFFFLLRYEQMKIQIMSRWARVVKRTFHWCRKKHVLCVKYFLTCVYICVYNTPVDMYRDTNHHTSKIWCVFNCSFYIKILRSLNHCSRFCVFFLFHWPWKNRSKLNWNELSIYAIDTHYTLGYEFVYSFTFTNDSIEFDSISNYAITGYNWLRSSWTINQ